MPSTFDKKQVEHLAKLAALSLTDDESVRLANELAAIIAYVEELSAVDTSEVVGMTSMETATPWREDLVCEGLATKDALAAAPRATETGFAVPGFVPGGER